MITVIADDFTGAAELAGIALRYHCTVELGTEVNRETKADVFILATDSRSLKEADAVQEMKKHTEALLALQPALIFKKTDSVLRGHILAELTAQLSVTECNRAILVAGNPALGRTIQNGRYFLHDKPIHESSFSHDPDFAITSSAVGDMLRSNGYPVYIKKSNDVLPDTGIIVGEVAQVIELEAWATRMDNKTLAAGAAGFFEALLSLAVPRFQAVTRLDTKRATAQRRGAPKSLFVCGTTFANSRETIQKIHAGGGPVSYMPEEVISAAWNGKYNYVKWANEVVALIKKHGKAIIAIHAGTTGSKSDELREKMAGLVHEVLQRSMIQELIIEGGATAWAVIKQSGITQFFPIEELAPGVVRMQTSDPELFVTVKPGSYWWPVGIWNF